MKLGVRYVFGLTSDHVLTLELDLDFGAFVIDRLLVLGRGCEEEGEGCVDR